MSVKRSPITEKEDMIMCIMGFAGDEEDETELWLNSIARGGLWHVSDSTFAFLLP